MIKGISRGTFFYVCLYGMRESLFVYPAPLLAYIYYATVVLQGIIRTPKTLPVLHSAKLPGIFTNLYSS